MGSRSVVSVAAVALFVSVGAAAATLPPPRLVSAALAKGYAQGSVHYESLQSYSDSFVIIEGDAATDRGVQQITYASGGHDGQVTVLVVANTVYIRGDAFTLEHYMHASAADAAAWDGKWLSMTPSSPDFAAVAQDVRLGSSLNDLRMPSPLRNIGTSTKMGRHVVGIRSQIPGQTGTLSDTLYIDIGRSLPVEQVQATPKGAPISDVSFSRWGEPVSVAAPVSAIAVG
jgi:hypothetical protein